MKTKRPSSVKFHILVILLIVWGLLFVMITLYGSLARNTLISEISKANENMLELYSAQLSSLCTEINRALVNLDIAKYPVEYTQEELSEQLSSYVLLYDDRFSFCFYNCNDSSAIMRVASNITYEERTDILDFFDKIEESYVPGKWNVLFINNSYYLMRFYNSGPYYAGSWISLDNTLNLYRNNQFDEHALLYFSDGKGSILCSAQTFPLPEKKLTDTSYIQEKYLALSKSIFTDELELSLLIPYHDILGSFRFITIIQWLIIGAFVMCVAVLLYYINYFMFKPLKALSDAMKEVKTGNYNISLPIESTSREFATVNAAFNDMVNEINYLKVSVYEREIFNQQLELEKLQLQVKPHFYLNCLNIIFNLAQGGDYKLIQELCMAQIRYFRYMLKSSFSTVTIKEEFAHIENYLHIQQLRYPGRYNIELSLNSEIENILIPPLTLHVFAENVIKHADSYGKINFSISAGISPDGYIHITITDDGPGFPADVLEKLQNGEPLSDDSGSHIGIGNTVKRLNLYYKNDCRILFQNREDHGTMIMITIPGTADNPSQNHISEDMTQTKEEPQ